MPAPDSSPKPPPLARPLPDLPYAPVPFATPDSRRPLASLSRRDAALDLFLVLLTALVYGYAAPALMAALPQVQPGQPDPVTMPAPTPEVLLVGKLFEFALAAGLALYLLARHRLAPAEFGLHADRPLQQAAWTLVGLVAAYIALLVTVPLVAIISILFPDTLDDLIRKMEFVQYFPEINTAVLLVILLFVAVHEELVFRGLLLTYLRRLTGSAAAALLVSSLLFGALHIPAQGWTGGLQTFAVGLAFGLCFLLSRSLTAVTIAHFLFNFLQIQIARLIPSLQELSEQAG